MPKHRVTVTPSDGFARRSAALLLVTAVTGVGCSADAKPSPPTPTVEPVVAAQPAPTAPTTAHPPRVAQGSGTVVQPVEVQTAELTAEGWLTLLESSAAEVRSLTARLRMTTIAALLEDQSQRFGPLQYAAADEEHPRMRFAVRFERIILDGQAEAIDQSYIYDGRWLLDLDGQDGTATRRELVAQGDAEAGGDFELGDGPFLLPLNLKKDRVLQKFNVELVPAAEGDPTSDAGTFHLRLWPKPQAGTDAQRIDLWFDRASLLPLRAATLEADDDQTIVDLFRLEANTAIDDRAFDTALPDAPGWETQVVPLD